MAARNYRDNAPETTITDSISTGDTSFGVASLAGYPSAPFTAALEIDSGSTEVILVTGTTGNTVTSCTRNFDGQGALSHVAGAKFNHAIVAADYQDANSHVNSVAGVHGVAGNVVGTESTQTLTNKTLISPALTSPTVTSGDMTVAGGNLLVPDGAVLGVGLVVQMRAIGIGSGGTYTGSVPLDASHASFTVDFDTLGAANATNGKITIPAGQGGVYEGSGRVCQNQLLGHSDHFGALLYKNDTIFYSAHTRGVVNDSDSDFYTTNLATHLFNFSDGDVIQLGAYADGGGELSSNFAQQSFLYLKRVS